MIVEFQLDFPISALSCRVLFHFSCVNRLQLMMQICGCYSAQGRAGGGGVQPPPAAESKGQRNEYFKLTIVMFKLLR
jgi:hypothetical protein